MKKIIVLFILYILITSVVLMGGILIFNDSDGVSIVEEFQKDTNPFNPDTDGDGLTDGEEINKYNTSPHIIDTDNDALNDFEEVTKYNTDPLQPDTDGDKLLDYNEINVYNTNPLKSDTDEDGLTDFEEVKEYNTDPRDSDSDNDGLTDGKEVNKYNTNPNKVDTDGDKVNDFDEVNVYNTNPNQVDTDYDRLDDWEEINVYNTDPTDSMSDSDELNDSEEINEYNTDPLSADTDDDGLQDHKEIEFNTDPRDSDSDNDGLTDGKEVNKYNTNPNKVDTDEDGFDDFTEVNNTERFNPAQKDVYIEVDVDGGVTQQMKDSFDKVKQAYANAPIKNPNGTTGIDLHIVWDSVDIEQSKVSMTEYLLTYKDSTFDNNGNGYYHILIVDNACSNGYCYRIGGVTTRGGTGALIQTDRFTTDQTANTGMHELGHMLGLVPSEYSGIDSTEKSFNEYPSVMNYNAPYTHFDYSRGQGFNGWKEINENLDKNIYYEE